MSGYDKFLIVIFKELFEGGHSYIHQISRSLDCCACGIGICLFGIGICLFGVLGILDLGSGNEVVGFTLTGIDGSN